MQVYANTFCKEYPINQNTVNLGLPAVLFGRYPGDVYDGGNPWQLLTAVLGETFYKGATANFAKVQAARKAGKANADPLLSRREHGAWMDLLRDGNGNGAGLPEKKLHAITRCRVSK